MPRRLAATLATTALAVSGLAVLAGPASAADPTPDYYPSGPQTDVPVATVTGGGWTQCHLDEYANDLAAEMPDVLSSCTGKYLMLAGRSHGSATLSLLAAAPRADVLFDTGRYGPFDPQYDYTSSHLANGSQWYYAEQSAWGFAPGGESVYKNSCDTVAGPLRLCWHTESPYGGYRIGDTTNLNASNDYERVIYQSDGLPAQAITFGTTAPTSAYVGQTYDVTATSDSGLDVDLSSGSPDVCTLQRGTVRFVAAGTCTVRADQAGDEEYAAAPRVTQVIDAKQVATTVAVSAPDDVVSGQQTSVTATLAVPADAPGGAPAGTVQFSVDGTALGGPVRVRAGKATSDRFARPAGSRHLAAVFTPDDTTTYTGGTGTGTLGVAKAATTTAVSVTPKQLTARVAPTAPGAGTPTGTVVFRVAGDVVGKAGLVGGRAVLDHAVEPGAARTVSAEYVGDEAMTGSSDSLSRRDPSITSRVTSSAPRSAAGWYRAPVRVAYTCTPQGAALTTPCPAADTAGEGPARTFTRSVSAADGGIGTVSTTVDVDRTAPTVALKGVKAGKRYFAKAPAATCVGSDVLSGLDSCVISTKRGRNGAETMTATATDKAGNVARTSTSYLVVRYAVAGADYVDGAYVIRKGTGINVQAQTATRPTYRVAMSTPAKLPRALTRRMVRTGKDTWVYGAAVNMPRTPGGIWYLGIQEGRSFTPIKVRMIG